MFLRGFEPSVTISPQTADDLGLEVRYVGEIVVPTRPLDGARSADFSDAALGFTSVVWPQGRPVPGPLGFITHDRAPGAGEILFVVLTALAVVATVLSVMLAAGRRRPISPPCRRSAPAARRYGATG